jgi:Transglutaminase-like superfamily
VSRPSRARRLAPTLRAAMWAVAALRRLRGELASDGLETHVLAPPPLRGASARGIELALRAGRATCLERSLIVQRWLLAQGRSHEVVVGVSGGAEAIEAHAWIDRYDAAAQGAGFRELARVGPRA